MTEHRISVRNLVEFMERSGDIDERHRAVDTDAMQKGSRLHRKLQKAAGEGYQSEVTLREAFPFADMTILVEGRADGVIFRDEEEALIEEIKGHLGGVASLTAPVPVHLAQAKCYGAILGHREGLRCLEVRMTYGDLDTEEVRCFSLTYEAQELYTYLRQVVEAYHRWLSFREAHKARRNASGLGLSFPFSYREGQRRMVAGVYHAIREGRQIFVQAPTGIGKTMSVIFPAVRSMAEGRGETLFYLTARTITRTVAQEAFSLLGEQGLVFQTLTLTSKEKLCPQEQPQCNPEACPYAKGHFDRVNAAVYELLTQERAVYDRETILAYAEEKMVCPFEFSLDLAVWMDAVICDYNYVFDPDVYLKRFFQEEHPADYLFLIDEAHNLAERAREMYSASLWRSHVLEARRRAKGRVKGLYSALSSVNRQLQQLEHEKGPLQLLSNPGPLPISLLRVQQELEKLWEQEEVQRHTPELLEELLDFRFEVRSFLNICELVDENYRIYCDREADGKCRVKLFCVNPATNLAARLAKGRSSVFFSATLLPMKFYQHLLSAGQEDFGLCLSSPFPQENRRIFISRDVSTVYTQRGPELYRRIAAYIAKLVWSRRGNYMIFFPSYQMLEDVYALYEEHYAVSWVRTLVQTPQMGEKEREDFLREFHREEGTSLAAFCIMGGIFSEGIDLAGEKLIGTIVVGAGLPMVTREREVLKQFYEKEGPGEGFDYAYRYPGLNKVLQAAGRVIRTPEDRGVILLLDRRFWQREYRAMLPAQWEDALPCTLESVEEALADFWGK